MYDTMFAGLDVHKAMISVAVARGDRGGEVRRWGTIPNRADHIRKLAGKLGADARHVRFCHEAVHPTTPENFLCSLCSRADAGRG